MVREGQHPDAGRVYGSKARHPDDARPAQSVEHTATLQVGSARIRLKTKIWLRKLAGRSEGNVSLPGATEPSGWIKADWTLHADRGVWLNSFLVKRFPESTDPHPSVSEIEAAVVKEAEKRMRRYLRVESTRNLTESQLSQFRSRFELRGQNRAHGVDAWLGRANTIAGLHPPRVREQVAQHYDIKPRTAKDWIEKLTGSAGGLPAGLRSPLLQRDDVGRYRLTDHAIGLNRKPSDSRGTSSE